MSRRKAMRVLLGGTAGAAALAAALAYAALRSSLPQLDGAAAIPSLGAPVTVERDALGVPTLTGSSRADLARALGFLHAQDRYFQMDLLRRRAAGELAALVGPRALPLDRAARMHGFRALSSRVLAQASPGERSLIEAYAQGVNAGLAALRGRPFEYLLLRTRPEPWRPEDCVLVAYAITLQLEDGGGSYERSLGTIRDDLGTKALDFLVPLATADDAALDGSRGAPPPLPSPEDLDLRSDGTGTGGAQQADGAASPAGGGRTADQATGASNCFAVDGARAGGGAAILANDMHLALAVPATWYRACLRWGGRRVIGITLPGEPFIVAGSNGRVAWGFTDADADTGDLVQVSTTAVPTLYRVPGQEEAEPMSVRRETIAVRGGAPETDEYRWTRWGPIVAVDGDGHPLAFQWTEHDPAATNFEIGRLEEAGDVREAVAIAHRMGVPPLNFIAADSSGAIAWTLAGRLPRRVGFSGRLPTSWAFGDRRWDGYVPADRIPTVVSPADGRVWSGNNRMVGGDALKIVGDGGYANPARARQLRDDLAGLIARGGPVTPGDLLGIELDDRGVFLEPWRRILLETLGPAAAAEPPLRTELRETALNWKGRADPDSAGYRIVRLFREAVVRRVFEPIFAPCVQADPSFDWTRFAGEQALQTLLRERPAHLLNPAFASWDDLLSAAADDVTARLRAEGTQPGRAVWGAVMVARIRHPLGAFLPAWLTRPIDMPAVPLPGDTDMPRLQKPSYGASVRFVVAPGHEEAGIFEMPGGQSGHPLSPYYRAGYSDWVRGNPAPLLPGPAVHRLALEP